MKPYLIYDARYPDWRGTPPGTNALLSSNSFIRCIFENAMKPPVPPSAEEMRWFESKIAEMREAQDG